MTALRKLLLASLLLASLAAPSAAQAAPDQVSIIMDDDQFLYHGDQAASRSLAVARSLGAEARPRDRAVARRRRGRGALEQGDRAPEDLEAARQGARPAQALQGHQPAHLPDAQLGSLRQPREDRHAARHARVLLRHRPGPELRAPDRPAEPARERRHVQAHPVAVPRLRAGRRHALQRPLQGRERHPRDAAEGRPVVAVERAQPAGLAVAAVGERRARLARALPRAVLRRLPGPAALRATARTRSSSARRRRSARTSTGRATRSARSRSCARSRASRPTASSTRGRPRRSATATTSRGSGS